MLRTLGGSRRTIRTVHAVEYGLTGLFAGLAGLAMGAAGAAALARFTFEVPFSPDWRLAPLGVAAMTALTAATGHFLGRGMLRRPPLDTLRGE